MRDPSNKAQWANEGERVKALLSLSRRELVELVLRLEGLIEGKKNNIQVGGNAHG